MPPIGTPLDELAAGLAVPVDPAAGYADGLPGVVSLGGGGLYFVAWLVGYLHALAQRDVRLDEAARVIGTSAGSVVGSVLVRGRIGLLHRELTVLARLPALVGLLAPSSDLRPSQQRALDLFTGAEDADPDRVRTIGHAALAARTPRAAVTRRNVALIVGRGRLTAEALCVTCVDAFSAERCVVTRRTATTIAHAVAASSAVPGIFAPQPISDRRCMDGGVSGTGSHLDLASGARRVVVLALRDGSDLTQGGLTVAPGSQQREVEQLAASGAEVFRRTPEEAPLEELMSPAAVPKALAMGARQAAADAGELRSFWG